MTINTCLVCNNEYYVKPSRSDTSKYCSRDCYVISMNGKGNHFYGNKHSDGTRKRLSIALSGKNHPLFGKHHSEGTKLKMSEAHTGMTHSDETKRKISENHADFRMEKSGKWKGGKTKDINGYIITLKPDHPFAMATGYISEHRIIAEKHLKRYLTSTEVIHHINKIRDDNRPENLFLFCGVGAHTSYHQSKTVHKLVSNII